MTKTVLKFYSLLHFAAAPVVFLHPSYLHECPIKTDHTMNVFYKPVFSMSKYHCFLILSEENVYTEDSYRLDGQKVELSSGFLGISAYHYYAQGKKNWA